MLGSGAVALPLLGLVAVEFEGLGTDPVAPALPLLPPIVTGVTLPPTIVALLLLLESVVAAELPLDDVIVAAGVRGRLEDC